MTGLRTGKRMRDLVEDGVRDVVGRALRRVRAAEYDQLLFRAALTQLLPCVAEAERPRVKAVAVHEGAGIGGDVLESGGAFAAFPCGYAGGVIEPGVRHRPDIGAAADPCPRRVELLHGSGQRAVGGREPDPVPHLEQDLHVLDAQRHAKAALAVRGLYGRGGRAIRAPP